MRTFHWPKPRSLTVPASGRGGESSHIVHRGADTRGWARTQCCVLLLNVHLGICPPREILQKYETSCSMLLFLFSVLLTVVRSVGTSHMPVNSRDAVKHWADCSGEQQYHTVAHVPDLRCVHQHRRGPATSCKSKPTGRHHVQLCCWNEMQLKSKTRFGKSCRWNKAAFKREQVSNEHSSNQEEDDLRKWVRVYRAYVDWCEF